MFKRFLLLEVMAIIGLILLAGCSNYNAVLYDNAGGWMNDEFLINNIVSGSRPTIVDGDDTPILDTEDFPPFRTHIINDINVFNEVFKEFPVEVNFEKEMLLIYIVTNFYMGNSYKISSIKLDGDNIAIEIKRQGTVKVVHAASAPKTRCFVVKMDKKDINTATFIVA